MIYIKDMEMPVDCLACRISCKHESYLVTGRPKDCPLEEVSAEAVQGYTEWLEKIIVDAETIEWLCEDTPDQEWCGENCHYSSIQAECLRHLYEAIQRR